MVTFLIAVGIAILFFAGFNVPHQLRAGMPASSVFGRFLLRAVIYAAVALVAFAFWEITTPQIQ